MEGHSNRKGQIMGQQIHSYRDLRVYQESFQLQQDVFHASKAWPKEEKYALTDQARRASRSVGGNIAESWAKRILSGLRYSVATTPLRDR
jgi:hypothetical protein